MSSGHKKLGLTKETEVDYEKAIIEPAFQTLWQRGYTVNRTFDIPYLGGYSRSGTVIYIDRDFDIPDFLVPLTIHEHFEKSCIGGLHWDYFPSHRAATHAEHKYVKEVLELRPVDYERRLRPVIQKCEEKLDNPETNWPPDLDYTPYPKRFHRQ